MREVARYLFFALVLSIFCGAAWTQSDGILNTPKFDFSQEQLDKGRSILLKAVDKCGGVESFKKVENFTLICKFEPFGQEVFDYQETRVFPDKIAKSMKTSFGDHTSVFNGKEGWTISKDQKVLMSPIEIEQQREELKLDQFYLYANADKEDIKVAFKGEEEYNGVTVFHLRVIMNDREAYSMFVDKSSYFTIGLLHEMMTQMGPTKIYMNLYKYTKFGDITLPSRIEQVVGDKKNIISEMVYTIGGDIEESLFVKPEGL